MSLKTRVEELAIALGTDVKTLTTQLSDLEDLVNSQPGTVGDATETSKGIVELATTGETTTGTDATRAVTPAGVAAAIAAVKAEILGGAGPAFDTLNELYALVQAAEESTDIANLVTLVGQKANSSDVYNKTEIGNPDTDFVAVYTAAKA